MIFMYWSGWKEEELMSSGGMCLEKGLLEDPEGIGE